MKLLTTLLLSIGIVIATNGCANYATKQTDISSTDKFGVETRTIITTVKATTFFDSDSKLASFKASQTDKTQSTSVGSLDQNSTGTNAIQALKEINTMLGKLGM